MLDIRFGLLLAAAGAGLTLRAAAPQLSARPESAEELSVRVLAGAKGEPKPTLAGHHYTLTRGSEKKRVTWYAPYDVWRLREMMATWKDRKGNVMRLARVDAALPKFKREHVDRAEIDAALEESAKTFSGEESELEAWRRAWGGTGKWGRFFTARNDKRYYVEFVFAVPVTEAEGEKLLKAFEGSVKVASTSAAAGGGSGAMQWWTVENEQYKFMSDLSKSQGGAFVKNAMRLMSAMRTSYEFYVPPQKKVGLSTVRVFKTLAGYRDYRQSTGETDTSSVGLWDPSREELLICAEGEREAAQEIMRHEAFHQYLYYSTGCGSHATWFNEGHATFFEHIRYDPSKNTVKIVDQGAHAARVERDPARTARELSSILKMDRDAFYGGGYGNYVLAWALTYFLEKGVYAHESLAPYRKVVPDYLEAMQNGMDAQAATAKAWAPVEDRDLAEDFLTFWNKYRNAARNAR